MKLQKWFRKNQRPMLAGFGALLVVGWLMGSSLTSLFKGGERSSALAVSHRYGKFTMSDSMAAQSDHRLIGMIAPGFQWEHPVGGRIPTQPLSIADWIALDREAASNGFRVSEDAMNERFKDEVSAARLDDASLKNRVSKDRILSAAGKAIEITEMAQFCASTAQPSLAEMRQLVLRSEERARVDAVVMPAEAFVDPSVMPGDDQIRETFEKYKNNLRGEGMDFGYMLPNAVKVEYIEIDRKEILANLRMDESKLERDARKFWEENRTNAIFQKPKSKSSPEPGSPVAPDEPNQPADLAAPGAGAAQAPPDQGDESGEDNGDDQDSDDDDGGGPRAPKLAPERRYDANEARAQDGGQAGKDPKQSDKPAEPAAKPDASASQPPRGATSSTNDTAQQPDAAAPGSASGDASVQVPPPSATTPARRPPAEYVTTWDEARAAAIDHLRKNQAVTVTNELVTWLQQRLAEPWIGLSTGADGYRTAPDQVKIEGYYQRVVDQALKQFPYPTALKVAETKLFSYLDIGELGDIGRARVMEQGKSRPENLGVLSHSVQGLMPFPEGADRSRFVSQFETSRFVLINPLVAKFFLFRVIEVRPSRAPASVDEVRDQVIKDIRLKQGFDAARQCAEKLVAAARSSSLKDAYDADADLVQRTDVGVVFAQPRPFAHIVAVDSGALVPNVKMNIVGVGMVPVSVVERIFALSSMQHPVDVLTLDELKTVVAVELKERIPANEQQLAKFRDVELPKLMTSCSKDAKELMMKPSNVRARAGIEEPARAPAKVK